MKTRCFYLSKCPLLEHLYFPALSPPASNPHGSLSANHSFLQNPHVWAVRLSALQALLKGEVRVEAAAGGGHVPVRCDLARAALGGTRFFKQEDMENEIRVTISEPVTLNLGLKDAGVYTSMWGSGLP